MSTIFSSIMVALALFANSAGWVEHRNLDTGTETHTMQVPGGTCSIGYNGIGLTIDVVTANGTTHSGHYMQNGRTPPGMPEPEGNPVDAFELAGCHEDVPKINSIRVRCEYMFFRTMRRAEDFQHYRCPDV
jgi:hypothetical protein